MTSEYGIRPHKEMTLEESEERRRILSGTPVRVSVWGSEWSPEVAELFDAPTWLRKAEQLLTGQEP